jgi:hypothetical protein
VPQCSTAEELDIGIRRACMYIVSSLELRVHTRGAPVSLAAHARFDLISNDWIPSCVAAVILACVIRLYPLRP